MIIAKKEVIYPSVSYRALLTATLLLVAIVAMGQKKIKLEPGAKQLIGFKKDGITYTSVTGDVKFTHKGTVFYCDSAVLAKKTNYLEAYGNVRILDNDSVTITSRTLKYDGNTRVAQLRKNVVLTKLSQLQIFTDYLDYDRNTGIANYFNNGKIVDTTNVLTSKKGYYNTISNYASFKTNVVGKNNDYTLLSDTLVYDTRSGTMYFVAPTTLTDNEGNVFDYEGGQYQSKNQRSNFTQGKVETDSYVLAGDKMNLDDIRGIYTVKNKVTMIAKDNNVIITGNEATYDKKNHITKVYNQPLMKMVAENDTLYVSADTLVSIDNELASKKRLLAYSNVKIFKAYIQGVADSLAYFVADSLLNMYGLPVLWSEDNQMSADSIVIVISNSTIDRMDMLNNAFVITKDSLSNYNQIKGRSMAVSFNLNQLAQVFVTGNGESIFYFYDQETGVLMGMNKIICSDIGLYFEDQLLVDAKFFVNPEGKFIPPHLLQESDKQLSGFSWRGAERPNLIDILGLTKPKEMLQKPGEPIQIPNKQIAIPEH